MAIPAHLTPITVTRRYLAADGNPLSGFVQFQLSTYAQVPVDDVTVPPVDVVAVLDTAGRLKTLTGQPLVLPASDDPDWVPAGLVYRVIERISGAPIRETLVNIPAAAPGGTVDLADLAAATPGPVVTSYVLAAQLGQPSGVAQLGQDGVLLAAQRPPSGGTSVKTVDSGFITTGDITVGVAFTPIGPDLAIAAAAGDVLELAPELLVAAAGVDIQFEAATRTAAPADNRYWSSGTPASRWPGGVGPWYIGSGYGSPRSVRYRVQADDVVTGFVTVRFYGRMSSGTRTVFANANYPLRTWLRNTGSG